LLYSDIAGSNLPYVVVDVRSHVHPVQDFVHGMHRGPAEVCAHHAYSEELVVQLLIPHFDPRPEHGLRQGVLIGCNQLGF
jgi:hypothetical protein